MAAGMKTANRVDILNRQRRQAFDRERLERVAVWLLDALGLQGTELSLVLLSDRGIRELNRQYLRRDRATDVLAFSQREGPLGTGREPGLLGDVVISLESARRQAAAPGIHWERELDRLLIHGVLHLLGYEHTRGPEEALRMRQRERALLRRLRGRFPG